MENIILILVLAVILIPAIRSCYLRIVGKKSCCGGSKEKVPVKKLSGPVKETYLVHVEGMHCDNCKNSIMRHLNLLDGVSAKVNLPKKTVTVSCEREMDSEIIKRTIEKLDFQVVKIEKL